MGKPRAGDLQREPGSPCSRPVCIVFSFRWSKNHTDAQLVDSPCVSGFWVVKCSIARRKIPTLMQLTIDF